MNLKARASFDVIQEKGSINEIIFKKYNIDIKNEKLEIALMLGDIICKKNLLYDDLFLDSELGKFIEFVKNMN